VNYASNIKITAVWVLSHIIFSVTGGSLVIKVLSNFKQPCVPCQKNKQHGVVEFGAMEPLNEYQPAPFIHTDNINGKFSFEDYDSLQNEVKIGKYVYEKKMVIMQNPPRTTRDCAHFISFLKLDDHWLHYDGMIKDPSKRFKPVRPKDYVGQKLITNSCTYTLKNTDNWN